MTDQEIICAFMETRPPLRRDGRLDRRYQGPDLSSLKWWVYRAMTSPFLFPVSLDLNKIWEVEDRIKQAAHTDGGVLVAWNLYASNPPHWHASATPRIEALAAVLRPIVEAGL